MGAPSPPPQKVETTTAPVKVAKAEPMSQSTEERQARNKKAGRTSLIVNRGGAQGLGGGDDNASIKKKTLG